MNDKDLKELIRINMDMVEMLDNSMARLLNAGEDKAPEPELYSGLTLEQWEVVMDGDFICEFWDSDGGGYCISELCDVDADSQLPFSMSPFDSKSFKKCSPLREIGIIQPMLDSDECREYTSSIPASSLVFVMMNNGVSITVGADHMATMDAASIKLFIVLP